jgi:phosphoribosylformylglycinamidine synthase subunit PurS
VTERREDHMKHYEVFVTGKQGIFDPPGETARRALANLGYVGIDTVKIGKYIQLAVEDGVDESQVVSMCEKLLANPVIEEFTIKLLGEE